MSNSNKLPTQILIIKIESFQLASLAGGRSSMRSKYLTFVFVSFSNRAVIYKTIWWFSPSRCPLPSSTAKCSIPILFELLNWFNLQCPFRRSIIPAGHSSPALWLKANRPDSISCTNAHGPFAENWIGGNHPRASGKFNYLYSTFRQNRDLNIYHLKMSSEFFFLIEKSPQNVCVRWWTETLRLGWWESRCALLPFFQERSRQFLMSFKYCEMLSPVGALALRLADRIAWIFSEFFFGYSFRWMTM